MDALAEVKSSLLEADVHYRVVQSLIDSVRDKALGQEVAQGVHPSQQFIKILHDELIRILGETQMEVPQVSDSPCKILLMGLQGSGKTTTAGKLARYLRDEKKERPILVPADTARPAAREQLTQLGQANGLAVYSSKEKRPEDICKSVIKAATQREIAANCLIFDTAGRLAIDDELMGELLHIREIVKPDLVLYVLDAMAGQDGLRSAKTFHERIGFDGVIVSKMDGDARGGAALSVRMVTGKPIYFLGIGEKADALEPLYPDRMVSRILGMGDVVTLVEKAQKAMDEKATLRLAKKIRKNQFTIDDFQEQLQSVKKMGSFEEILGLMPGGAKMKKALQGGIPQDELKRTEAIISSMTFKERANHQIINGSRRKRIALGSGTTVTDVNRFLKQFVQAKTMMTRLSKGGLKGLPRGGFF